MTTPIEELMAATPVRYFWSANLNEWPDQLLKVHGPIIESWQPVSKKWVAATWAFDNIYTGEPGARPIEENSLKNAQGLPTLVELTDEELAQLNRTSWSQR